MSGPARPEEGSSPCPARLSDGSRTGVDGRTRRLSSPRVPAGGERRERGGAGYVSVVCVTVLPLRDETKGRTEKQAERNSNCHHSQWLAPLLAGDSGSAVGKHRYGGPLPTGRVILKIFNFFHH